MRIILKNDTIILKYLVQLLSPFLRKTEQGRITTVMLSISEHELVENISEPGTDS